MRCICGFCSGPTRGMVVGFDEEKLVMEQWYPCNPLDTSVYEYEGAYIKDIRYDVEDGDDVIIERVPLSVEWVSVKPAFEK